MHRGPYDLLVEVRAVSVNPVDVKVRASREPKDGPEVIGYDAAGVVDVAGTVRRLPFDDVAKARVQIEFSRPEKEN